MENKLEILRKINKVEAPPFLYTRIQQKLKQKAVEIASPSLIVVISIILAMLFISDLLVLNELNGPIKQSTEQGAFFNSSDLYHE